MNLWSPWELRRAYCKHSTSVTSSVRLICKVGRVGATCRVEPAEVSQHVIMWNRITRSKRIGSLVFFMDDVQKIGIQNRFIWWWKYNFKMIFSWHWIIVTSSICWYDIHNKLNLQLIRCWFIPLFRSSPRRSVKLHLCTNIYIKEKNISTTRHWTLLRTFHRHIWWSNSIGGWLGSNDNIGDAYICCSASDETSTWSLYGRLRLNRTST